MSTLTQLVTNYKRRKKKYKKKTPALKGNPQKLGTCLQILTVTPRKPNSGLRRITRVRLSNGLRINCHIPGGTQHNLQKFSTVLVLGGRSKDVPGIKYRCMPGKYSFRLIMRKTRRSRFGLPKPKS